MPSVRPSRGMPSWPLPNIHIACKLLLPSSSCLYKLSPRSTIAQQMLSPFTVQDFVRPTERASERVGQKMEAGDKDEDKEEHLTHLAQNGTRLIFFRSKQQTTTDSRVTGTNAGRLAHLMR
eukprot:Selendium_serpulae@DN2002_c0_g1_i1.p1